MKFSKSILILFVVAFVAITSCKKESFNINQDPNNVNDSTIVYNLILPSAQNNTARQVGRQFGWLQNYLSFWARSGTFAPNSQEESYEITTSFQAGIWSGLYDNIYDYDVMLRKAKVVNADFYTGIARVMKSHNFALLVDLYNNAPYKEALQGNNNITPKYDNGIDIYKDLFRQLDTAIVEIRRASESTTGPNKSIAADDIMFGNTLFPATTIAAMKTRWVRFANTLKLRMLVHLMNGGVEGNTGASTPASTVAGFDIAGEFTKIAATGAGYLASTSGDLEAEVQPGYRADKGNPFYNLYVKDNGGNKTGSADYYKANDYAIGYLSYNGDPRETKQYTTDPTGGYRGVPYGLPSSTANAASELSGIGAGVYRGADKPQWIMTACETYFLIAEAIHRGFIPGLAAQAKINTNLGITKSFIMLGLTAGQAAGYISGNSGYADVDYSAPAQTGAGNAKGGIFTIITQKWFALNSIAPFEVWTDYRRVDFSATKNHFVYGSSVGYAAGPAISVAPSNSKTEIPIRLLYPQSEYNFNPANVASQGVINAFSNKIFWNLN
jgi:Starch-binding associating with outer membrane